MSLLQRYPHHYHDTVNALIAGDTKRARACLSISLRYYRSQEQRIIAIELLEHAMFIGYPLRKRPSGCYR